VFRGLINDAKSAVSSVVLKYVARASVAVPFVVAGGFALAAGNVMLVERYGHVFAYWSMAGGLAAVGLVAALAVRVKEHEEEVADVKAEAADTSLVATEVAKEAPLALLGGLLTTPGGLGMVVKVAKMLGNNYALVLLLVAVGTLLWPTEETKAAETPTTEVEPPAPIPPENIVAFADRRDMGNGSRAWLTIIAIGFGLALAIASLFLVDPMETKRAIMAQLGW
jgi:hypothetical protein